MTNRPPKMTKWIFVVVDLLLLAGCTWALRQFLDAKYPYAGLIAVAVVVAWMYGAWMCVTPWIEEFRAETKLLENESLADSLAQIQRIEEVASRIQTATGSWQSAQDSAARTATTAKEVHERIKADMKDFMEFSDRVNSEEKKHLQLEIDKLRRAEGDWLQVTARLLDHTFALNQAAQRSGQPHLVNQLSAFQQACRDAVRRMGLVPFQPVVGDPFDGRAQQLEDPKVEPPADARIADVLATGYMFQGQLLRRALVRVASPQPETPVEEPVEDAAPTVTPTPSTTAPEPEPEPEPTPAAAESEPEPAAQIAPEERPAESAIAETALEPSHKPEVVEHHTATVIEESIPPAPAVKIASEPAPSSLPAIEAQSAHEASTEPATPAPIETKRMEKALHARIPSESLAAVEGTEDLFELAEANEEQPKRARRRKPDPQASLPF